MSSHYKESYIENQISKSVRMKVLGWKSKSVMLMTKSRKYDFADSDRYRE